jgi:hypothetical protein
LEFSNHANLSASRFQRRTTQPRVAVESFEAASHRLFEGESARGCSSAAIHLLLK